MHSSVPSPSSPAPRISASIVDNEFGGPVSLVKAGGRLDLSGTNTYTGGTHLNEGQLYINSAKSLPDRGDVNITSGVIVLDFASATPVPLGTLTLQNLGTVVGRQTSIDARVYSLLGGSLDTKIAGNGKMRVDTSTMAMITSDNPNFSGDVEIVRGALLTGGLSVSLTPSAVGTGNVIIRPGGTLVHSSSFDAQYNVLSARIQLAGGDVGLHSPTGLTRWEFRQPWEISDNSRLLMFDITGEDNYANIEVVLRDTVRVHTGASLGILGNGTVAFDGNVALSANSRIESDAMLQFGTTGTLQVGPNTVVAAPGLAIRGRLEPTATDSSLTVSAGTQISGAINVPSAHSLELRSAGQTLRLALNSSQIVSGGGTIKADIITSAGSILSPGDNGVGTLSVSGIAVLSPQSILNLQIDGKSTEGDQNADVVSVQKLEMQGFTDGAANQFVVRLLPLNSLGTPGAIDGFDPQSNYAWDVFRFQQSSTLDLERLSADTSQFTAFNPVANDHEFVFARKSDRVELLYRRSADFDGNKSLNVADIDLFCHAFGSSSAQFDLNDNGTVDQSDLEELIQGRSATVLGDANLDGRVDFSDFLSLSNRFTQSGSWSNGDFDCTGHIDFTDFLILVAHFGQVSTTAALVHEPNSMLSLVCVGMLQLLRGSTRKRPPG